MSGKKVARSPAKNDNLFLTGVIVIMVVLGSLIMGNLLFGSDEEATAKEYRRDLPSACEYEITHADELLDDGDESFGHGDHELMLRCAIRLMGEHNG